MIEDVLKFTKRFKDCDWMTGNCYYFAVILKERFGGRIYYNTTEGHFVTRINGVYYDYNGIYIADDFSKLVAWDGFSDYDPIQYGRIMRDCVENNIL